MKQPIFYIIKPGVHSLIQDLGRIGYQQYGVSTGGPADIHAYLWANKLLNNQSNSACLEVHFGMLELKVLASTQIAIAGAEFDVMINNKLAHNWRTHFINKGDMITFRGARRGKCGYISILGGFSSPQILGSQSVVIRDHLSPELHAISKNQYLYSHKAASTLSKQNQNLKQRVPQHYIPNYNAPLRLNFFPCYQWNMLSESQQNQFLNTQYDVTSDANRMGVRLAGKPITSLPNNLQSEGIALGSIQLTTDGQPIVLLNDRQTIGGYPKTGIIASIDCAKLYQAKTGHKVVFKLASPAIFQHKIQAFMRFFDLK